MVPPDNLPSEFFRIALHYYIAGRFAVLGGLYSSVAGNLFHHAVEMFLKGHLAATMPEKERRNLSHDLVRLWNAYKAHVGDPALRRFDEDVHRLHKFEDIRYPEAIVARGMILQIAFAAEGIDPAFVNRTTPPPAYLLRVDQVDALVETIFQKANVNPRFFSNSLKKSAHKTLRQWNEAKCWAPEPDSAPQDQGEGA